MNTSTDTAVCLSHVSKRYRLGARQESLRGAIAGAARALMGRRSSTAVDRQSLWALRDVELEIPRGGALGLIGPNGAGKTTILKILGRITQPTEGDMRVSGRVSALIELGAGFHPDLTGRENIYLNGAILGLSQKEIERVFDRIVDFSGLERFLDTPVKRYSSGMYVRLGFSVAAFVEPDVLLVDEVLAVGDAEFRQKCAERIQELRQVGTTIVFVAHNLYLVKSVCDSAIFLEGGQIQAKGDPITAISAYETWLQGQQIRARNQSRFTPERSRDTSSTVDVTHVEVIGPSGAKSKQFDYRDAVEIRISFSARKPLVRHNIVVRILRSDGTTCSMIRTSDHGFDLGTLEGKGSIGLKIDPLQLTGGAYAADVVLTGEIDGVPIAQGYSDWFRVTGPSLSYQEASGVYVPQVSLVRDFAERVEPIALNRSHKRDDSE